MASLARMRLNLAPAQPTAHLTARRRTRLEILSLCHRTPPASPHYLTLQPPEQHARGTDIVDNSAGTIGTMGDVVGHPIVLHVYYMQATNNFRDQSTSYRRHMPQHDEFSL